MAYLRHPRWKALIMSFPIPFTLTFLSLGRPIDATNIAGLIVLLLYTHAVRFLRYTLKLPIIICILISAGLYCIIGGVLASVIPKTDLAFWVISGTALAVALIFQRLEPDIEEQGHRSPIPLIVKIPMTVALVVILLALKQFLKGFMTLFPMVGVFASYEARNSLWTNCKQIPIIILTLLPMFVTIKLTQVRVGTGLSVLFGWGVFLIAMIPVFRNIIKKTQEDVAS